MKRYTLLSSFTKRLKKLYDTQPRSTINARHGPDAASHYGADEAVEKPEKITKPYQYAELDAHQIDANIWLPKSEDLRFGARENFVVRPWLLVLIECYTRAVLAYLIVMAPEPNHWDVLRLIKKAIIPWQRMPLTVKGLHYGDGAGMPSGVIKGCMYAIWNVLRIDNALAFLANDVRRAVKTLTGGTVNDGPGRSPERRLHVKSLFNLIEQHGYHRIPNTVGSGPDDPCRKHAVEAAFTYKIGHQDLLQFTEVLIANRNADSYRKAGGMSPLDKLRVYTATEHLPILDDRQRLIELNPYVIRTVLGNQKKGRAPYMNRDFQDFQ